jgi:hypothetical protein
MKKVFLLCLIATIGSTAFAINLKCTSNNETIIPDKGIKFISDQSINFCPDRIGLGSSEEQGMTISSLVYVKKENNITAGCLYRNHLNIETSCTFIPLQP